MKKEIIIEAGIIVGLSVAELQVLAGYVKESIKVAKKQEKKQKPGESTLFSEQEINPMTTFRDSTLNNFELFEKEMLKKGDLGIDLYNYYQDVKNWSDKKPKEKRTARGWAATAKDFMRRDHKANKLVMKTEVQANSNTDMLDYLRM